MQASQKPHIRSTKASSGANSFQIHRKYIKRVLTVVSGNSENQKCTILADSKTPFNSGQGGIFRCVSVDIPQFRQIGPVLAEPNVTGTAKRTSLYT